MEQTLDIQDIEVLDTGRVVSLSSENQTYSYTGGDFTTNPNDYIEVLVYDINNNFLENATVDESDYKSNLNTGLNLNTGTILRKLGYDRGRYVVKYNFFRRAAGSDETLLVNNTGTVYTGEYSVDSTGTISDTNNNKLLLKENKYYIHEISDSRSEIRLVPEKINNFTYKDNFLKVQTDRNTLKVENGVKFVKSTTEQLEDSIELQFPGVVPKQAIGGTLLINNAFIETIIPPPGTEEDEGTGKTEETNATAVDARFYISDISQAFPRGNDNDLYFTKLYKGFKGVTTIEQIEAKYGTSEDDTGCYFAKDARSSKGLEGIQNLGDAKWNPIELEAVTDKANIITLKSISKRPLNVEANYKWELSGYDRDTNKYEEIKAGTQGQGDVDVRWLTPDGQNSKVVEGPGLDVVTFAIYSKDTHVGIRLTVTVADKDPSMIIFPACIETDKDR